VAKDVRENAVNAAMSFARENGLPGVEPVVLADGANVVVHLRPAPVVVKAAATTLTVRPDAAAWLAREVDVARHVAAAGLPVVRQSDLLPSGVHVHSGVPLTCWELVETNPAVLFPAELAELLRELHRALATYPGELPYLGTPLLDIARFLDRGSLPAEQISLLRKGFEPLRELGGSRSQALHGDPHPGNLLHGPQGWIWCDFEDTCSGPLEWDLAAVASSTRIDGRAAVAAYGDVGDLEPWMRLRRLHVVVWYCLYAERLPALVEPARSLLTEWLAAAQ
jgi:hypothetical protein